MNSIKINSIKGLLIALAIIGVWLGSLVFLFSRDFTTFPRYIIPFAVLWQSFLYTGLFITAHDAMHGCMFPIDRKFNDVLGTLVVLLYALFSYKNLLRKHWEHHHYPASEHDPDYHDGLHKNFFSWYFLFMRNYISWKQIVGMAILFNVFEHIVGIPVFNLILFWIMPSLLSTFQLFYFGTYLPHREPIGGYIEPYRARSNKYPVLLSFITCYHFGYHWEHHAYPNIPWWRLPKARNRN